jgi:serine/threonine protein kinase
MTQQLSEKSDVYSFGVVLLELLTARAPIEHGKYIVNEVRAAIDRGGFPAVKTLLDPRIQDADISELGAFLNIAMSCVSDLGVDRPSMGGVVKQLEELINHEYPESGSSTMEFVKNTRRYPYGFDSASRESSIPSFSNSAIDVQPPSSGSL